MNKELWVSLLTFFAGALALATQMLPVSPDIAPYLLFVGALVNLALGVFFGVNGFKTRAAAKAKAAK